ncbi:MAG: hypothetical protein ACTHMJ_24040 [Thermomicrobiales bacterium]
MAALDDAALVLPDERWFCWSLAQEQADGSVVCHLQGVHIGKDSDVTVCGIPLGVTWTYNVESGDPYDWDGCKRCRAVMQRRQKDAALIRHAQALWEAGRLAEWREAVAELRRREMGE